MSRVMRSYLSCIALLLVLCFGNVALAAGIQIISQDGVAQNFVQDAQLSADLTQEYFRKVFGENLDHDVKILLVPNRDAYVRAHIVENKVSAEEAERRAKTTRAWSQNSLIIQNAGNSSLNTQFERILNMSHELVHQYQRQKSAGKHTSLEWLSEGTADVLSATICEDAGLHNLSDFRKDRLKTISNAKSYPKLGSVRMPKEWYAALDLHGSRVTYRLADMAVFYLIDQMGGNEKLMQFPAEVRSKTVEESFKRSFGMTLEVFEMNFDSIIAKEINDK